MKPGERWRALIRVLLFLAARSSPSCNFVSCLCEGTVSTPARCLSPSSLTTSAHQSMPKLLQLTQRSLPKHTKQQTIKSSKPLPQSFLTRSLSSSLHLVVSHDSNLTSRLAVPAAGFAKINSASGGPPGAARREAGALGKSAPAHQPIAWWTPAASRPSRYAVATRALTRPPSNPHLDSKKGAKAPISTAS